MVATAPLSVQLPLIHVVETDDLYLQQLDGVLWFSVLRDLDWHPFVGVAARYYEALWQFNVEQSHRRDEARAREPNPETREEAKQRLFEERPTQCGDAPILCGPGALVAGVPVDASRLCPGAVPYRLAGRQPKCFFAMLKAFLGLTLRGRAPEAEHVHDELVSNPAYARACGFTLPDPRGAYRQSDVPGLRKLEQFDQIMDRHGLWGELSRLQVQSNLTANLVEPETTLAHDTVHYHANSALRSVELPATKKGGKPRRVSHPRTTKACRCKERSQCSHAWVSADEGAGTVNKSTGKAWGHKASTIGLVDQGVILDAVAMTDAASHDSKSVLPHLERVRERFPELLEQVTRIVDDSAADSAGLKKTVLKDYGIKLLAPINVRGRKVLKQDLPRGIDRIEPTGTPVCKAGIPLDFLGCRHATEHFLFRAPLAADGQPVCTGCVLREACCRAGGERRQVSIPFTRLPWIDPEMPQLSRTFHLVIAKRTAIERIHKLMKFDYGHETLSKRGTPAFQGRLDKTVLAMHLVIAHR